MIYDAIVIGGGSIGTSIFRCLCLRGFNTILLEKGRLASGTTSSSHQNLVGGMRYVIKDPIVAKECAKENQIISRMFPNIIGKLNNYFIGFKNDYTEEALKRAKRIGIIFKELDMSEVFKEIPMLNRKLDIAVEVSDKNIDVIELCRLNCLIAERYGGNFLENTEVHKITEKDGDYKVITNKNNLKANYIVNATGSWADVIASKIGVKLPLVHYQGTIIVQKSLSPRGIQYFHKPSDGDAYIVHEGYAWLGTTSIMIENPNNTNPESGVEKYLKNKFSIVLPNVKYERVLRKYIGVRSLWKSDAKEGRDLSRDFKIYENPKGVFHIIGGKMTTSRLIGEKVVEAIK